MWMLHTIYFCPKFGQSKKSACTKYGFIADSEKAYNYFRIPEKKK